MTSAFTLLRALLAVLWLSAGMCAADCAAMTAATPAPVTLTQTGDTSPAHCSAHCEDRTSLSGTHRAEKTPTVIPGSAVFTRVSVPPATAPPDVRRRPASPSAPLSRQGLDDLKTIRLLI